MSRLRGLKGSRDTLSVLALFDLTELRMRPPKMRTIGESSGTPAERTSTRRWLFTPPICAQSSQSAAVPVPPPLPPQSDATLLLPSAVPLDDCACSEGTTFHLHSSCMPLSM